MVTTAISASQPVHLAFWEKDKENVRPLIGGRKPSVLADIMRRRNTLGNDEMAAYDEDLQRQKSFFEERINAALIVAEKESTMNVDNSDDSATVDDPEHVPQLWWEYAQWLAQHSLSDSREERVVLERATSELVTDPRFSEDIWHLKLWLRLAEFLREPQEIFSSLWARGIGTSHTIFYEAWATSLERQGCFGEAEEVVDVGLARNAQPINNLRSFREVLLSRVREWLNMESAGSEDQQTQQRPVFNSITVAEARQLQRPQEHRRLNSSSMQLVGNRDIWAPANSGRRCTSISCFNEVHEGKRPSIFDAKAEWCKPPAIEEVADKENRKMHVSQPWGEKRVRRRAARVSQNIPTTTHIYVDEEFRGQHNLPTPWLSRHVNADPGTLLQNATGSALPLLPQPVSPPARSRPSVAVPMSAHEAPMLKSITTSSAPSPLTTHFSDCNLDLPTGTPEHVSRRRHLQESSCDLSHALSHLKLSDEPPIKRSRLQREVSCDEVTIRGANHLAQASVMNENVSKISAPSTPRAPRRLDNFRSPLGNELPSELLRTPPHEWTSPPARLFCQSLTPVRTPESVPVRSPCEDFQSLASASHLSDQESSRFLMLECEE